MGFNSRRWFVCVCLCVFSCVFSFWVARVGSSRNQTQNVWEPMKWRLGHGKTQQAEDGLFVLGRLWIFPLRCFEQTTHSTREHNTNASE